VNGGCSHNAELTQKKNGRFTRDGDKESTVGGPQNTHRGEKKKRGLNKQETKKTIRYETSPTEKGGKKGES